MNRYLIISWLIPILALTACGKSEEEKIMANLKKQEEASENAWKHDLKAYNKKKFQCQTEENYLFYHPKQKRSKSCEEFIKFYEKKEGKPL